MALPDNATQAQVVKEVKTLDNNAVYNAGTLTTVAGSATEGAYLSVRWYNSGVNGITTPYDGMKLMIRIPLAGVGTAGAMLSINGNNAADYHPLAYNVSTVLTSHFAVGSYKIFTYDAAATMTCYKTSNTSSTVTGVWKGEANYDSNSYAYVRQYQSGANAAGSGTKYPILARYNLTNKSGTYDTAYTRFHTGATVDTSNGNLDAPTISENGTALSSKYALASAIPDTSNMVTTDTAQTISGAKTFSATDTYASGCGFSKSNNLLSDSNPAAMRALSSNPFFGLRCNSTNYYLQATSDGLYLGPTSSVATSWASNGDITIRGTNQPKWNSKTLATTDQIPTVSYPVTDVQVNSTSIVSSGVANLVTNTAYNSSSNKIATMSDIPSIPTNYVTTNTDQTISGVKTFTGGISVSGRSVGGGDDEGIVVGRAVNNYAGLCLGSPSGMRSVFYLTAANQPVWRWNNGTTSYDIVHPNLAGTIAIMDASTQTGSFYATSVYASSDERLKENIKPAELDCGKVIDDLQIKEFNFKADEDKKVVVGAIAQELKAILPEKYQAELVSGSEDTQYSINEGKLLFVAIGALKEEREKTKELEERLARLEELIKG